jgi:hypothetical protein
METFSLDQFSTDLIVECILQHLETSASRPYVGNASVAAATSEDLKKWYRLSDTFLQCLRHDLKKYKVSSSDGTSKGHLFQDRIGAATVVSKWYPDLFALCRIYDETFAQEEEPPHKDFSTFYVYLHSLQTLSVPIYSRQFEKQTSHDNESKRDEVVFLYDENI